MQTNRRKGTINAILVLDIQTLIENIDFLNAVLILKLKMCLILNL